MGLNLALLMVTRLYLSVSWTVFQHFCIFYSRYMYSFTYIKDQGLYN